jgi:Sec-independent protein translocase protein TatA
MPVLARKGGDRMQWWAWLVLVIAVLILWAFVANLPDLRRYMRIRKM